MCGVGLGGEVGIPAQTVLGTILGLGQLRWAAPTGSPVVARCRDPMLPSRPTNPCPLMHSVKCTFFTVSPSLSTCPVELQKQQLQNGMFEPSPGRPTVSGPLRRMIFSPELTFSIRNERGL